MNEVSLKKLMVQKLKMFWELRKQQMKMENLKRQLLKVLPA